MENNLKYIVYLTTNIVNNKIYIGVHKTLTPYGFDGYIGNGVIISQPSTYKKSKTPFQFAVNKHGIKNFKRTTIKVFDDLNSALNFEKELVNEEFVKRKDTYNATIGGGIPASNSIEIYQYDLHGKFIKCWKDSVEAANFFNIASNNIRNAIHTKSTSCGYLWSDLFVDELNLSEYNITIAREWVYKFDPNNKLINEYKSVVEAAKENGSTSRLILNAISGQTKSKGFYYSYNKDFIINKNTYKKLSDIYLYDLAGKLFKHFSTPRECADYFNDTKTSRIYAAIRTGGLYKGYQISNENLKFMKNIEKPNAPKKVGQYDLNDNLIKVWDTIQSAYLEYGPGVKKCLKGLLNKTKGYKFKYIN